MNLTPAEMTHYAKQFKDVFDMLPQDKGSKLLKYVTMETGLKGDSAVASDQIGTTEVNEVKNRYGDSPHNEVARERRWYNPIQLDWGHLFDRADKVRTLGDPQNAIAVSARNAFGRKIDDKIIEAFFGVAKTGETGTTNTNFDSDNIIAHSSAGMTVAKLEAAKVLFEENDIDLDLQRPVVVLSPKAAKTLREEIKYVSKDYGEGILDDGRMKPFLGFDFIIKNRLPISDNIRTCPCFVKSAMGIGIWEELMVEITKRGDKKLLPYIYMNQMYGASRLDEKGCINIQVSEA